MTETPRFTLPARADDRIWRVHPDTLIHVCGNVKPQLGGIRFRDSLDPMALGTCRYCHRPLPIPETNT